jgi:glycosyltransferase involved in cell wall biosynthesis
MIEDKVTGLVFKPEDSDELAEAVESLIKNRERRDALGRAAREWVRRHRTWARNAGLYRDLYEGLEWSKRAPNVAV